MTSAYGSDAIWDAFDDSIITIEIDGTWHTYGQDQVALSEPLFGVTAWNPGTEAPLSDNTAANLRLKALLVQRGITHFNAVGSSPDHAWSEPGFVLAGIERDDALEIARIFGQLAIHEMSSGKLGVVKTGIAFP